MLMEWRCDTRSERRSTRPRWNGGSVRLVQTSSEGARSRRRSRRRTKGFMLTFLERTENKYCYDYGPEGDYAQYRYSSIKPSHVGASIAAIACKKIRRSVVLIFSPDREAAASVLEIPHSNWVTLTPKGDTGDILDYVVSVEAGTLLLAATRYGIEEAVSATWLRAGSWLRVSLDGEYRSRLESGDLSGDEIIRDCESSWILEICPDFAEFEIKMGPQFRIVADTLPLIIAETNELYT